MGEKAVCGAVNEGAGAPLEGASVECMSGYLLLTLARESIPVPRAMDWDTLARQPAP